MDKDQSSDFQSGSGHESWPVAHTLLAGQRFMIYEVSQAEGSGRPGEIFDDQQERIKVVAAGQEPFSLKTVQPFGKPKMDIKDFQRSRSEFSSR